jgi:hypothetical protein
VIAIVLAMYIAFRSFQAQSEARAGKNKLLAAERHLNVQSLSAAGNDLRSAAHHFRRMRGAINALGPLRWPAEIAPLLRVQVRGARAFADTGEILTRSGLHLVDAAERVIHPKDRHLRLRAGVEELRSVDTALKQGLATLEGATQLVGRLDGYRLVGPLNGARNQLRAQLPRVATKAISAEQGVRALIDFAGGSGPRSFLVLSQNPDEVRPTGGFIGTYGVLNTNGGELRLDRFEGIENWYLGRPQAVVPAAQAGSAFALDSPPVAQTIANVNNLPDWPTAAKLAETLWQRGGEAPVNGVLSITPDFMASMLTVLGPVTVPEYNETVTASNLVTRADYWTHAEGAQQQAQPGGRKHFLAALAHVVLDKVLDAPSSDWYPLGKVVAAGFNAREAMAWSNDPVTQQALSTRRWDGALPSTYGDFVADAEFEYSAKNGRGLKRVFDHTVELRADGSAKIHTKLTINNTDPPDPTNNINSLSYITMYGPTGAELDRAASDEPDSVDPLLSDHPAEGYFRSARPLGSTTLDVTWNAPGLLDRQQDGSLIYQLTFWRLAGHTGDVLRLRVKPPVGWRWAGAAPPKEVRLDTDLTRSWRLVRTKR